MSREQLSSSFIKTISAEHNKCKNKVTKEVLIPVNILNTV